MAKPACIHVIKDGQVWRVNPYTGQYEAPEVKKVTQVFVVGDPTGYVVLGMDGSEQVEKEEMPVDQDASAQEKGPTTRRVEEDQR